MELVAVVVNVERICDGRDVFVIIVAAVDLERLSSHDHPCVSMTWSSSLSLSTSSSTSVTATSSAIPSSSSPLTSSSSVASSSSVCVDDIELVAVVVDVVERIFDGDIERDAIVIVATDVELECLVLIICV
jgi:hypothetical protein